MPQSLIERYSYIMYAYLILQKSVIFAKISRKSAKISTLISFHKTCIFRISQWKTNLGTCGLKFSIESRVLRLFWWQNELSISTRTDFMISALEYYAYVFARLRALFQFRHQTILDIFYFGPIIFRPLIGVRAYIFVFS